MDHLKIQHSAFILKVSWSGLFFEDLSDFEDEGSTLRRNVYVTKRSISEHQNQHKLSGSLKPRKTDKSGKLAVLGP
jgi:hypothetical protein